MGKTIDNIKLWVTMAAIGLALGTASVSTGRTLGQLETDVSNNKADIVQTVELIDDLRSDTVPRKEMSQIILRFEEMADRLEKSVDRLEDNQR